MDTDNQNFFTPIIWQTSHSWSHHSTHSVKPLCQSKSMAIWNPLFYLRMSKFSYELGIQLLTLHSQLSLTKFQPMMGLIWSLGMTLSGMSHFRILANRN